MGGGYPSVVWRETALTATSDRMIRNLEPHQPPLSDEEVDAVKGFGWEVTLPAHGAD
jgi:hypothetical protein